MQVYWSCFDRGTHNRLDLGDRWHGRLSERRCRLLSQAALPRRDNRVEFPGVSPRSQTEGGSHKLTVVAWKGLDPSRSLLSAHHQHRTILSLPLATVGCEGAVWRLNSPPCYGCYGPSGVRSLSETHLGRPFCVSSVHRNTYLAQGFILAATVT